MANFRFHIYIPSRIASVKDPSYEVLELKKNVQHITKNLFLFKEKREFQNKVECWVCGGNDNVWRNYPVSEEVHKNKTTMGQTCVAKVARN